MWNALQGVHSHSIETGNSNSIIAGRTGSSRADAELLSLEKATQMLADTAERLAKIDAQMRLYERNGGRDRDAKHG